MKSKSEWKTILMHEVGHAVDFKRRVMRTHGKKREFGGWEEHTTSSLADAMLKAYDGRDPAYEETNPGTVTPSMLKDAITAAANNKLPDDSSKFMKGKKYIAEKLGRSAASNQDIIKAVAKNSDYQKLPDEGKAAVEMSIKRHPAVIMAKKNFKIGAWNRNDSTMEKMAAHLGGRYFQRSYPGKGNKTDRKDDWTSFDVSSRKVAVSNYQYRAPSEWFAELYAHYYLGTLAGHPLYNWFEDNINVDMDPDPDASLSRPADPSRADKDAYTTALQ